MAKTNFTYTNENTKEISFPIGGIGTGSVGLSGNGRLIDWEIFNRPAKQTSNGFSGFIIKAKKGNQVIDVRALCGDYLGCRTGGETRNVTGNEGFGGGPDRSTMAGVPHFEHCSFEGTFPFASITFSDFHFPGKVILTAFNPLIPTNEFDSSIPAAFFKITIQNDTGYEIDYSVAFSLNNPFNKKQNQLVDNSNEKYIKLLELEEENDMCIATDCEDTSYQEYWFRGEWFDNFTVFWQDFITSDRLKNRSYENPDKGINVATIVTHCHVKAKSSMSCRFVMSWSIPFMENHWEPQKANKKAPREGWKNYYATVFKSSYESAKYSLENFDRLYEETLLFKNALFSSTLPLVVIEAVSANIAILKSPTVMRLEDGSLYGYEGCLTSKGSCPGSCTHVWNYAYALPFLFPRLERSMRDLDYKYNMDEIGGMHFRLQLPLGRKYWDFRPCADGHFGGIIKIYREWKICGDDEWLRGKWEYIKKNIEYAWHPENPDKWDPNKDGVLFGRQHHTLDMELFGANSWLTGFYLAALKAAAEMAVHLGESSCRNEYEKIFNKGKKWIEQNTFNGEYFYQSINLKKQRTLSKFKGAKSYWNKEAEEIKYQIGNGVIIDQVLADWHATLTGLGEIYSKELVKSSLQAIYKYNFKKSMREHFNPCRLYCVNDESGVVMCEWPDEASKPTIPIPYSQETMHGFEYQVAAHMISVGMVNEGLEIVEAIRNRYKGDLRNPWNEFECGSNYARSMSSYSLLNVFSGFKYDMSRGLIGFNPITKGDFKCFWSLDSGFGTMERHGNLYRITVLYGSLCIKELSLPLTPKSISADNREIEFKASTTFYSPDNTKLEIILKETQTITNEIVIV